ncbi:MAG TPA: triose-phosphate isomerase [Candidatus Paceibacterota bacterium]|nr:triose-phosphate isomerase [Candidatus Paceibacterota bacterium]
MLIVGNWKAYIETVAKAKSLLASAKRAAAKGGHDIVLAPPAPFLGVLITGKSKIGFAAQDLSLTTGGAETGEVTAGALSGLGVAYAIVGHSERRARGETDAMVAEKVRHALAHSITPILCIGETARDTEGKYLKRIREEIRAVYEPLSTRERLAIVIAYEPIWAIGKAAADAITPPDLHEMILYIRKVLGEYLEGRGPQKIRVLYGGSVEPENARSLAAGSDIDGFLVGRASTDAPTFTKLVKAVS